MSGLGMRTISTTAQVHHGDNGWEPWTRISTPRPKGAVTLLLAPRYSLGHEGRTWRSLSNRTGIAELAVYG